MKFSKAKNASIIFSCFILFLIVALTLYPQTYMQSILNGLDIWLTSVVPALFPFFFLTKLLTKLGFIEKLSKIFAPFTQKLFKCPGISGYVFFMSIISGYPVGSKLVGELYENGKISKTDAIKMNSFCSTSGPLFVIGTIGVGMLLSQTAGIIILISHIFGAILNGFLFRNYKKNDIDLKNNIEKTNLHKSDDILKSTMEDSIISIFMVGGYIVVFYMIIDVLFNFHILSSFSNLFFNFLNFFNLPKSFFDGVFSGIVEVTRGAYNLSSCNVSKDILCVAICGLVSFGGISIHLQSLTFLSKCKIKMSVYLLQKITHSIFSMLICALIMLIL